MKKITRAISRLIRILIKVVDKKIVLPITKCFVWISNKLKGNGRDFEKIIANKTGMIVVSLILAVAIFFFADMKSTSLIETSAEVLYDQSITAIFNEEAYVVEGLPETVDITLIGRKSDIYLAKQLPTNDITVDLTGLTPGVHKVNLKYKKALSSVEYKLDPSVATIVIYEKKTEKKEINYEVINKDKIDSKLLVEDVSLDTDTVYVKASEATLAKVASVKALVNLDDLSKENRKVGTHKLSKVGLVAYDAQGKKIDCEVVPSKIDATVKIKSPSKEVPIKVIPKKYDKMVFGKAISAIETDISKVTIYGEDSAISKIDYLPVEVDVSGLKSNKKYSVTLKKPSGVRAISSTSINVNISIGEETSKEINDVRLDVVNIGPGLYATATEKDTTKITVIAKGVKEVLQDLDPTTIKTYIDLSGKEPGIHKVKINVEGTDLKLKYQPKTEYITIKITKEQ